MSVKEHERPSTDFTRTAIVGRIRGNVSRVDAKIKVEFDLRPRLAYYWWVPPREARSRFRSPVTTTCWSYAHPSPKGSNQSLSRLVLVPPPVHDTYKRPYQIVQIITTTTSRITTTDGRFKSPIDNGRVCIPCCVHGTMMGRQKVGQGRIQKSTAA